MKKKLYRLKQERIIAGVCGGLGKYFKIDANLIRLGWVLLGLMGGGGIVAYLIAWWLIPEEKSEVSKTKRK